jgi:hypothetical protein
MHPAQIAGRAGIAWILAPWYRAGSPKEKVVQDRASVLVHHIRPGGVKENACSQEEPV